MANQPLGRKPVWLSWLIVGYGCLLVLLTVLKWVGPDRWWLGAMNLYLPQAAWLAPVALLAVPALLYARRWLWVLGFYGLWICGPIMGFHWAAGARPTASSPSIRVVTCNIKYGQRNIEALVDDIVAWEPDIVLLQDVKLANRVPLGRCFKGWNVHMVDQFLIASRMPLGEPKVRWIPFPGSPAPCLRTEVVLGGRPIALYNVHFLTPRDGLNAFRWARKDLGRLGQAIQELRENVDYRLLQARTMAEFIRQEQGEVIVAGDLNSLDESLACRSLRDAGLHDAFTEGGRGYGYTYGHFLLHGRMPWLPRLSWMRIDHVLVSSRIRSLRCWTGTKDASDHRPVFADLILTAP